MDILSALETKGVWLDFLEYRKTGIRLNPDEEQELRAFISKEEYLSIVTRIRRGEPFPHPRRVAISKQSTSKKRIVYIYPKKENLVLKLMTHLLRQYDHLFCPNLYSFRAGHGVKEAVFDLTSIRDIGQMWSYKADISKLFENPIANDLTWARWFFPLITTDRSLHVIDRYAQQCIRTLATGTHTKASYNFRYEQIKELGYISLVNRYYSFRREENGSKS